MRKKQDKHKRIGDTSDVLTPQQELEVCVVIRDAIVEGKSRSELVEDIHTSYPTLSVPHVQNLIQNTINVLSLNVFDPDELQNLVNVHVDRYEQSYQWFKRMDDFSGMQAALFSKERLLGYHRRETKIEVEQQNNQVIVELNVDTEYDFSKLTKEEKIVLDELLNRVRVV